MLFNPILALHIINFSSCLKYWGGGGGTRYVCPPKNIYIYFFFHRGATPPPPPLPIDASAHGIMKQTNFILLQPFSSFGTIWRVRSTHLSHKTSTETLENIYAATTSGYDSPCSMHAARAIRGGGRGLV